MAEAFNLPTKEQFDLMNSYLANISIPEAAKVTIADAGSYYTSENVEGALQEAGESINSLDADFVAHKADYVNSQTVTSIDFPFAIGFEKSSQARVTKIGKFVTVTIGVKKTDNTVFTQGTPIVIGQLPVGYRPLNALIVIAGTNSVEWAIKDAGYVYIATDGMISVTNSVNTTAKVFYFNASYIVN